MSGPAGTPTTLMVAVLTFRRPDDIAAALPLLAEQAAQVQDEDLAVDLLVVDNDPDASARKLVAAFSASSPAPVRYVHEPIPGISAARNRALTEAADRELLIFFDDDERPTESWLCCLVDTYRRYGSAAVAGPVISDFAVEPDPWIVAGEFFVRRRLPTGTDLVVAATNNLLLDLRQVRSLGLTFDEAFGIGGGGDTMFTRSLHRSGATLTWCDEAVVLDVVPASRLTRRWVVSRAFRSGNSWSLTSMALQPRGLKRLRARIGGVALGLVRLGGGAVRLALGVATRSIRLQARGVRTIARGLGMVAGAGGYSYLEYRRS